MSGRDLDIDQLARYLRLPWEEVERLAVRGKIPGRKVNGRWRFSESDVHHWMEERIGQGDAAELGRMESILDQKLVDAEHVRLADILRPESTAVPLDARTRGSVIREMCQLVSNTGMLWDFDRMLEAVQTREDQSPTAMDCGVALLHPKRPQSTILGDSVLALGITTQPLPFGNNVGNPSDIFFLIASANEHVHLRILTRLSRLLKDSNFLLSLRQCSSSTEALHLIRDAEAELLSAAAS